ncbi:MAG TPA: type VI secretion system baseplate subunit TssE [Gemmataceae bacterium]|nr:type VI secretion system baseplate subunit TssE [Gemmataceae bacterium]
MARIRAEQPLVPSVLDRLLDDDPDVNREAPKTRHQVLRDLKQAVRRDLENLLNTRRRCRGWPAGLKELEKSLVNYGIPDFTGARMSTAEDRDDFRRALETVLRTYESRFKSVKVLLLENTDESDRTLRFRIDGLLVADPAPEPVVFDSALEPTTGGFQVKGVS